MKDEVGKILGKCGSLMSVIGILVRLYRFYKNLRQRNSRYDHSITQTADLSPINVLGAVSISSQCSK